jgi:hypothetical protein
MKKATTEAERRAERLAQALRANLGRRKTQARGRDALEKAEAAEAAEKPDAKISQDPEA